MQRWKTTLMIVCLVLAVFQVEVYALMRIDFNQDYKYRDFNQDGAILPYHLSELNFVYENGSNILIVGKKGIKMGPGYFSQLMLSHRIPLDMIYYEGEYKFASLIIKGEMLTAILDPEINKQLFVHRISNDTLVSGLEVGVSESMMVHDKIHWLYYSPVPFWPYYLTTKLLGMYSEYNLYEDKYIGIDYTYKFLKRNMLYGELLVDEFPQRKIYNNPRKLAYLVGFKRKLSENINFRYEYSKVFNYVYVHRFPQNVYTYRGQPIGHSLGPDSEVTDFEIEYVYSDKNIFRYGIRYSRKGIGDFAHDFYEDADYREREFLFEVTKTDFILRCSYENKWSTNSVFNIVSELDQQNDKIADKTSYIYSIDLKISFNL